jgi:HlyD family secretion protein
MRKRAWIATAAAVILMAAAFLVFRPKPVVDIKTAEVTSGTVTRRIFATGTLQATRTVDIGAQVSGVVSALNADFNVIVHKGQIVARLDPSLYRAALDQTKAAQAQAEASVAQSRADLGVAKTAEVDANTKLMRAKSLAAGQLITQADVDAAQAVEDEARAAVNSAEAQVKDAGAVVEQAKAAVTQATVNLDHTVIQSPIDGIVISRNVDVGQTVAAAVQAPVLFTLATDLTHLQLQVNVDQGDVGGVDVGAPVSFEVESYPDEMFRGVVAQVRIQPIAEQTTTATTVASSTLGAQTSTVATVVSYATMIDVDNPDARLRPGMTATLALRGLEHDNVTRVPNAAMSFRPSADVFSALHEAEPPVPQDATNDSNRKSRELWTYDGRQLTPHLAQFGLSDDQWTELATSTLHPGDRIVVSAGLKPR